MKITNDKVNGFLHNFENERNGVEWKSCVCTGNLVAYRNNDDNFSSSWTSENFIVESSRSLKEKQKPRFSSICYFHRPTISLYNVFVCDKHLPTLPYKTFFPERISLSKRISRFESRWPIIWMIVR